MSEHQRAQQGKPKIGAGHAGAMFRGGLSEMANILPAFNDSIKPINELGLYGTKLPGQIYNDLNQSDKHQKHHGMEMER